MTQPATLEQALLAIINSTTNAIGKGVEFLSGQLPEVIHQLLLWHAIKSGVMFTVLLGCIIVSALCIKYLLRNAEKEVEKYKHQDVSGQYLLSLICFFIGLGALIAALHNLTWLQIIIAPKVYLIEYAASLIK